MESDNVLFHVINRSKADDIGNMAYFKNIYQLKYNNKSLWYEHQKYMSYTFILII